MDYDTAMEGHPVSYRQAVAELRAHGNGVAMGPSGELLALDPIHDPGTDVEHWHALPLDSAAILEWLGY